MVYPDPKDLEDNGDGTRIGLKEAYAELRRQELADLDAELDAENEAEERAIAEFRKNSRIRDEESAAVLGTDLQGLRKLTKAQLAKDRQARQEKAELLTAKQLRRKKLLDQEELARLERENEAKINAAVRQVIPWSAEKEGLSAGQVHEQGILCAKAVSEVSRKSGNLKGSCQSQLNHAAINLQRALANLTSRCSSDETERLEYANSKLTKEVQELKTEVEALRKEVARLRRSSPCGEVALPPLPPDMSAMTTAIQELQRSFSSSIGALSSRLDGLEVRLSEPARPSEGGRPPAPRRREEFPPLPAPKQGPPITRAAAMRAARANVAPTAGPSDPPQQTTSSASAPPVDVEMWETATGRKRRKRKNRRTETATATTAPATSGRANVARRGAPPAPAAAPKRAKRGKTTLKRPRSTAVVMQLRPEAVASGVTYAQVMARAAEAVSLESLGITEGLRTRTAQNGAKLLEIPGVDSANLADRLAERLREVVEDAVTVVRPEKCADLRISEMDDYITAEDIASAVSNKGGCARERVKVGAIRDGPNGSCSVLVRCPIGAAKVLSSTGRLLLRLSSVRVSVLEPRPMRCFKCMGLGHARLRCPSDADYSETCFRCGQAGHKVSTCTAREPRCAVCFMRGRPHSHVMGSRACNPPVKRARAAIPRARSTARREPAVPGPDEAMEEAEAFEEALSEADTLTSHHSVVFDVTASTSSAAPARRGPVRADSPDILDVPLTERMAK